MTVEYAPARAIHKPWGITGHRPWRAMRDSNPVGKLWFERSGEPTSDQLRDISEDSDAQPVSLRPTQP